LINRNYAVIELLKTKMVAEGLLNDTNLSGTSPEV
jgi:hypothetical protein